MSLTFYFAPQSTASVTTLVLEELGTPYLVGDFTLADAHVNSFIDWLRHMKIDMTSFPHLNAWSKRGAERPAYARAMQRENAS